MKRRTPCTVRSTKALDELASGTGWELAKGRSPTYVYVAAARGVSLQLLPRELYLNTSRDAYLLFRIFSGRLVTYDEESRGLGATFPPTERLSDELRLERTETLGWCWTLAGLKPRANQEIATYIVKTFVGAMDSAESWSRE